MNDLNSVLLEGQTKLDPEVRETSAGTATCVFSVVNQFNGATTFVEVRTAGRLAEVCGKSLKKGQRVRIIGQLEQERWVDPVGVERVRIYVMAEHVEFKAARKEVPA